ncbi:cytochrome P450 (plasmid) [Rhizobium sp. NIBRBAC000502774]|nr:cytochrome P450 [Rhizobium sp. NIBRBAC000502774]
MSMQPFSIFDASSEFHQTIGLLKTTAAAASKHGDAVILRLNKERDVHLLTGEQSVSFWLSNFAHLPAEFGDLTSNATTMNLLQGNDVLPSAWSSGAAFTSIRNDAFAADWNGWFDATVEAAAIAFLDGIALQAQDLQHLARLWSVRAVCHTVFGSALPDIEMANGLLLIEDLYAQMNAALSADTDPTSLKEFKLARAFLDLAVRMNVEAARPGDRTVLSTLLERFPENFDRQARHDHLRSVLVQVVFERLSIDGLNLLWALLHLAQDPDLVDAIAEEARCSFKEGRPDSGAFPLAMAVAKEIQRLYPELPFIFRTAKRDLVFRTMTISAGSTVLFSPWLLHRDGRYWTDPARFDPTRFLGAKAPPRCYLAFGTIGQEHSRARFVCQQIAKTISLICCAYTFALPDKIRPGDLRPVLHSTLRPRGTLGMHWRPRTIAAGAVE